jgi:DNA-binding GntR family transcriptional regulator
LNSSWRSSVSLVEETAAVVRERVFAGRYQPGDRLAQEELSAELGLSRTPLREAYRVLAQDGLLDVDPGGTARVATWDAGRLSEAYEFRQALGTTAVRLACPRLGERTLSELERLAGEQSRASGRTYHRLGSAFHCLLLEASGNSHLQRNESLVRMTEEVFRPRYGLLTEHILAVSAAHAAVVSALRAGDQDSAELQIRSYISHELHIVSQQERLSQ